MKKRALRIACCLLAGTVLLSSAIVDIYGTPVAGVAKLEGITLTEVEAPLAGVSLALSNHLTEGKEEAIRIAAEAAEQVTENEAPVVASEYADIAIAQVNNYVNVRQEPSTEAEVVGKLYDNSAATVLETTADGWYKITSGNVTGYVKCEYVVVGDEELAREVSTRYATVTTQTLYVREEPNTDSRILTMLPEGDDFVVIDESMIDTGWVKVTTEAGDGYISTDYVELWTDFVTAESKEEEEARLAKEEAERKAAAEAARRATEQAQAAAAAAAATESSASQETASTSYSAPSGSNGQAVADYACQFVGNPYVYGGTSLTNGADCSGFVMSVYAAFGISLPHSSKSLRSSGYEVSTSEMQPGDIICYSGHVAIYIGNDTIVHASTKSTGIKLTSPAAYKNIICVRRIF